MRTFTKKEWDSQRKTILRNGGEFVRIRLASELFVLIATVVFAGSTPLLFSDAKEFTKKHIDNAVVEGRGKPFYTSSTPWAMTREKKERKYESLGPIRLSPQAVRRLCKSRGIRHKQTRPADSGLLLSGFIDYVPLDPKTDEFVLTLTSKQYSECSNSLMEDSDKLLQDMSGFKGIPPSWDTHLEEWMNPTG